jgi:hypothetical protein
MKQVVSPDSQLHALHRVLTGQGPLDPTEPGDIVVLAAKPRRGRGSKP